MKFKSFTLIVLFSFFVLLSCSTKRKVVKTIDSTQTTLIRSQSDSTRTKVKEKIVTITDTTKTTDNNISIVEVTNKVIEYKDNNEKAKESETTYKHTTLYISEEDRFLFENGYLKDSTEVKRADDLNQYTDTTIQTETTKEKKMYDKIAKTIGIALLSIIVLFVLGSILYKKVRDQFKI